MSDNGRYGRAVVKAAQEVSALLERAYREGGVRPLNVSQPTFSANAIGTYIAAALHVATHEYASAQDFMDAVMRAARAAGSQFETMDR